MAIPQIKTEMIAVDHRSTMEVGIAGEEGEPS